MKTASTWTESFNILLDAYEQIGENIPQFEQYGTLFNGSPEMQKVLGLVYADILEFHRRALKFFKRRSQFYESHYSPTTTDFPFSVAAALHIDMERLQSSFPGYLG
jgi:hypothetical protein